MSYLYVLRAKNASRNHALIPVLRGEMKLVNLMIKFYYLCEVTDVITSLLPHEIET